MRAATMKGSGVPHFVIHIMNLNGRKVGSSEEREEENTVNSGHTAPLCSDKVYLLPCWLLIGCQVNIGATINNIIFSFFLSVTFEEEIKHFCS